MKQCLVTLLRQHLLRDRGGSPLFEALHHPRLARAVLAVIEAPAAPHTVESLASHAGMSRASFAEHFSRAFRQGPIDFVQKLRLRVAARLLATTDLPLKVIAQSVGYAGRGAPQPRLSSRLRSRSYDLPRCGDPRRAGARGKREGCCPRPGPNRAVGHGAATDQLLDVLAAGSSRSVRLTHGAG